MPEGDKMRLAEPRVKLTYEDFLLFPDDGQRHELVEAGDTLTTTLLPGLEISLGRIFAT